MDDIRNLILNFISGLDLGIEYGSLAYEMLVLLIVVIFLFLIDFILRLVLVRGLRGLFKKVKWLNWFSESHRIKMVQSNLVNLITVSIFIGLLTLPFPEGGAWYDAFYIIARLCQAYFFFRLLVDVIDAGRTWLQRTPKYRDNPMIALLQAVKVIVVFIGALVAISLIFSIDMTTIFGSLAALSAILMLIFKDTILGFVASIRLISNDMIHVGDWITVPGKAVDGNVTEITLTTVKVKGFDNSVYTIPPYELVGSTVQNWAPMQASGARLCSRPIYIDMSTIRNVDDALMDRLRKSSRVRGVLDELLDEAQTENSRLSLTDDPITQVRVTNLGLFRNYVLKFLEQSEQVDHNYAIMCYQSTMTEKGLPLNVRFFTKTAEWNPHETIVANVFEHLFAVIRLFDLNVYQKVSSSNVAAATPVSAIELSEACDDAAEK